MERVYVSKEEQVSTFRATKAKAGNLVRCPSEASPFCLSRSMPAGSRSSVRATCYHASSALSRVIMLVYPSLSLPLWPSDCADLLRLRRSQRNMGLRNVRRLYLFGLLGPASANGRAHQFRAVSATRCSQLAAHPGAAACSLFILLHFPSLSAVHCSSTELDKWTPDELRAMVVGGNDAARAFFRDKGWTDMLSAKVRRSAAGAAGSFVLRVALLSAPLAVGTPR